MSDTIDFEEIDLTDDTGEDSAIYFPPLAQYSGSSIDAILPGLIAGIEISSSIDKPIIDDGIIRLSSKLPYAQFGSSVTTPGIVAGMTFSSSVDYIRCANGYVSIPVAQFGKGNDSVTGGIAGISFDSTATEPYIAAGHIYLPPTDSSVDIPLAQYQNGSSVTGLIAGIEISSSIDTPIIENGMILMPTYIAGLANSSGETTNWLDLPSTADSGIVLSTHYVGSYKYNLRAFRVNNYLGLSIIQDFTQS